MGIFNKLSGKSVDNIVDGAIKGVDKLMFTNEERADFNKTMADSLADYTKATLNESTTRSITRRFIAFAVIGVYLLLHLVSAVALFFDDAKADAIFDLARNLDTFAIMVGAFFFTGYYLSKVVGQKEKKK